MRTPIFLILLLFMASPSFAADKCLVGAQEASFLAGLDVAYKMQTDEDFLQGEEFISYFTMRDLTEKFIYQGVTECVYSFQLRSDPENYCWWDISVSAQTHVGSRPTMSSEFDCEDLSID